VHQLDKIKDLTGNFLFSPCNRQCANSRYTPHPCCLFFTLLKYISLLTVLMSVTNSR